MLISKRQLIWENMTTESLRVNVKVEYFLFNILNNPRTFDIQFNKKVNVMPCSKT